MIYANQNVSMQGAPKMKQTIYAGMEERRLLLLFREKEWALLTPEERLNLLQEVENRRAQTDGRPPIEICVDEQMGSNTLGAYADRLNRIFINKRFMESGKLSIFTGTKALETTLHEGRHAFQHHAIREKYESIPLAQRLEWSVVLPSFGGIYTSFHPAFYFVQSVEMDARRFARRKLAEVNNLFKSMGIVDPGMEASLQKSYLTEIRVIQMVRQMLTMKDVEKREKWLLDEFRRKHPELDLTDCRPLEPVRYILQHPELKDRELVDHLDQMADKKMGLRDDRQLDRLIRLEWGSLSSFQ